jgi:HEPN domain-containing protein
MTAEELRRRRIESFRKLAFEEMSAAKMLSESHSGQSAYFLQQCVEKLVRGVLEIHDVPAGPTHQIAQLAYLLGKENVYAKRFAAFDELSVAATRYRYPGPHGEVRTMSAERLAHLLREVEGLREEIDAVLMEYLRVGK